MRTGPIEERETDRDVKQVRKGREKKEGAKGEKQPKEGTNNKPFTFRIMERFFSSRNSTLTWRERRGKLEEKKKRNERRT
jgi:hypothetical protein